MMDTNMDIGFSIEDIQKVYGEDNYSWYDYTPMLELFGEIVVKCDQDDYQGDTLAVVKKDGKYGYINFGWGSCSGCDALQACDNVKEVYELAKEMWESVTWYNSKEEIKAFVDSHDYDGDWTDKELVSDFKKSFAEKISEVDA